MHLAKCKNPNEIYDAHEWSWEWEWEWNHSSFQQFSINKILFLLLSHTHTHTCTRHTLTKIGSYWSQCQIQSNQWLVTVMSRGDSSPNLDAMPMANTSKYIYIAIVSENESRISSQNIETLSNKQIIAQPTICASIFFQILSPLTLYAYSSAICLSSVIAGPLMSHWEMGVSRFSFLRLFLCAVRCCLWATGCYATVELIRRMCLLFTVWAFIFISMSMPQSTVSTHMLIVFCERRFIFSFRFFFLLRSGNTWNLWNETRCLAQKRKSIGANTRSTPNVTFS